MNASGAAVARSTVLQVGARAGGLVLSLASAAYLTRRLGVTTYGRLALVGSLVAVAGTLADAGFGLVLGRELSRRGGAPGLLGVTLRGRLIMSAPVTILAAGLALLAYGERDGPLAVALMIGMIQLVPMSVTATLAAGYQAQIRLGTLAGVELVGRILQVGGAISVAAAGGQLSLLVLAGVAAAAVQAILTWHFARWPEALLPPMDWAKFRHVARLSWALGIAVVLNTLYARFDAVLLSFLRSGEELGRYLLAYRVLEMTQIFPSLFGLAVLPLLTEAARNPARMREATGRAVRVVTIAVLPVAVLSLVLAQPVVTALGGLSFAAAAPSLAGLAVAVLASGYNIILGLAVIALDGQRRALWLNVSGLILNALLNLAFVPRYGAPAAAWATSTSDAFLTVGLLLTLRGHLGKMPSLRGLLRLLPAGACTTLVASSLRNLPLPLPLILAMSAYLISAILSRQVDRSDLTALREAMRAPLAR